MVGHLLYLSAAALFLYITFWCVVGKERNRLNTVDVAWGGGFILIAWIAFVQIRDVRNMMIAVLVTLWGIRLMMHLWRRVRTGPEDSRYEAMKQKWHGNVWTRAYFSVFLLQGLLILLIGLPIIIAANPYYPNLTWLIYLGAAIWFVGFTIERIADDQLREFVNDPEKPHGKVMDQGLWRYSRHPNYFGELTQWWGIAVIALQSTYGWAGLFGPLILTFLILFVSGIPPIEKKKKLQPEYADYMRRTSVLIPLPPKRG
jgi:steroid 5-alpha reductase family enzyme